MLIRDLAHNPDKRRHSDLSRIASMVPPITQMGASQNKASTVAQFQDQDREKFGTGREVRRLRSAKLPVADING